MLSRMTRARISSFSRCMKPVRGRVKRCSSFNFRKNLTPISLLFSTENWSEAYSGARREARRDSTAHCARAGRQNDRPHCRMREQLDLQRITFEVVRLDRGDGPLRDAWLRRPLTSSEARAPPRCWQRRASPPILMMACFLLLTVWVLVAAKPKDVIEQKVTLRRTIRIKKSTYEVYP